MLSKKERFQQWRGSKANAEQLLLDSALLISDYVDTVAELEVIKENAVLKHKEFDKYDKRPWGTLIFSKLFMDEAIEQLPGTADKEKEILTHASTIVSRVIDDWSQDTKKNILDLLEDIDKFLLLDEFSFTDKKAYQAFILSSYMVCQIIKVSLDNLNWKSHMFVALIINVEQTKEKIAGFLQKLEQKAVQLKQLTLVPAVEPNLLKQDPLKNAKDLLSQHYFKVLSGIFLNSEKTKAIKNPRVSKHAAQMSKLHAVEKQTPRRRTIIAALSELEVDIDKISSGIANVVELRNKQVEIEKKIKTMQAMLMAAEENEQRITGRKYFQDFIENYADAYQTLLENTEEKLRESFVKKINQAKNAAEAPDLSTGVINGMSWVTTPLTMVYRTATPQPVQDMLNSKLLPATLDSMCKAEFKELTKACLTNLKEKLNKKNQQITAINNRYFRQDEELKQLIAAESPERLMRLLKANDAMKDAVQCCSDVLITVQKNLQFLNNLKEKSNVLNEFIKIHDTFFVKVTNFLAQFFSVFKTSTGKMIDKASVLKKQVDGLASEYQHAVDQEMLRIDKVPSLDKKIKTHLKRQFLAEETEKSQEKIERFSSNKHNVRLLMNSLSQLFASKPHPILEKKQADEEEHYDVPILVC